MVKSGIYLERPGKDSSLKSALSDKMVFWVVGLLKEGMMELPNTRGRSLTQEEHA
jgi:hypothetical protein